MCWCSAWLIKRVRFSARNKEKHKCRGKNAEYDSAELHKPMLVNAGR